jgi:ABC-type glycerol-3-phosphate transport system permease component
MRRRAGQIAGYAFLGALSAAFLYPFYWMAVSSFRTQEGMLVEPLRPLPESLDPAAYVSIREIGGVAIEVYALNSLAITVAATLVAVAVTALGAYAIYRRPDLPLFRAIRVGFLLTMMYPAMLLVIPIYFVMHRVGLLGSYAGIVLFLGLMPILFLMFDQFLRSIPRELVESAQIDGASELQILRRVVLPIARPVVNTVVLIGFLLNWKQWLPILVIAATPDRYTLPVALLAMNTEWGVKFQSTMALATLTTVPIVALFLATQKRVIGGFVDGAVKG